MEHGQVRTSFITIAIVTILIIIVLAMTGHKSYSVGDDNPESMHGNIQELPHNLDTKNRMYSISEVNPLVTGQLYSGPRSAGIGHRWIYGGRTSHGGKRGLREFSTGVSGQAGVDIGPLGMQEYSLDGRPDVFDDGIPENWQISSTPVNWYVPDESNYQHSEVYDKNIMSLKKPDHDPLFN